MTANEQLVKWVNGDPVHDKKRDICCPDFSCCRPELLAPEERRIEFLGATEEKRNEMPFKFLAKALQTGTDKKVYVTGKENSDG